ncbi:hypothetical protein GDO86_004325 [Hymenochirus boettgeri]|uniref:Uncharacterized protein n=1 Tax=Hymenochirus boettgeri TaxID=247094 RepID=A0A8T2K9E4_9PIPI|nr:hypothetical protein GDO86_004325 [Hymenochirus boettgeri]
MATLPENKKEKNGAANPSLHLTCQFQTGKDSNNPPYLVGFFNTGKCLTNPFFSIHIFRIFIVYLHPLCKIFSLFI